MWKIGGTFCDRLPVEYPCGVDAQPRDDPREGEAQEHEVTHLLVVCVLAQLSTLKKVKKV